MGSYYRGWKNSSPKRPSFFERYQNKIGRGDKDKMSKFLAATGTVLAAIWHLLERFFRWIFFTKGVMKKIIILGGAGVLIFFIFFGLLFVYYSFTLPDPNNLITRVVPESTKIMDRNGKQLYEIHGEAKRTLIPLEEMPKQTKEAVLAIEDKDFYKHGGISIAGIARSALKNLFTGSRVGGSTITQQFVRNAVLTREKTYTRKFKEVVIAMQLERHYEKDDILQLYLNEIPFGSNAYGIQAAAQTYFGKDAKNLDLVESAYLAALPQAPTYFSPYGPNREALDNRADTVMQLMYEQGYITKEERNRGQNREIEFRNIGQGILAPHFVLYVQDLLAQKYGEVSLQEGGFKVTTTLDIDLQTAAEEIVSRHVADSDKKYNAHNASLVAIDPKTGQILAMVGSRDYFNEENDGAVNVALRPRQPGSSFKPYVYATAFKEGMNPATMLLDVTTNFGEFGGKEYIPQNYDGKNRGPVSIRQALQGSLNIPAVKTLLLTGIEDSIQTAESMGITTLKDRSRFGPAIVLGGAEVKLLEHTAAYGVFATNGTKHETIAILKVEDKDGKTLEEYRQSRGREVLHPQIAYQITNVLSDNASRVYIFGQNNRLHIPGRPIAAKTGTTQEYRDAWTIGYTPSIAAGVWMGNNDNSPMTGGASGSLVAAAIWNEFMRKALEGKPVEEFARPDGVSDLAVDSLSGKLPGPYTLSTKIEVFATNFNLPTETDDVHINGGVVLHSEKPDDPAWEDPVRAWALANGYTYPPDDQNSKDEINKDISIEVSVPQKITSLPWKINVETEVEGIPEIQIFINNLLLTSALSKTLDYDTRAAHVDGKHQVLVQVRAPDGKINRKTVSLEFALGLSLIVIAPSENQTLQFPANVMVESNQNVAPDSVKFFRRSTSGKEKEISGSVTRSQTGQIYIYTLNWPESDKPAAGSYQIYGQINGIKSNAVTIKIP